MGPLNLSTRLFLACFLASALLLCGIYFYVKGFNGQREITRAQQAFERSLSRYGELLKSNGKSLIQAALVLAENPDATTRKRASAEVVSTGLVFVVLRATAAESDFMPLSPADIQQLRASSSTEISLSELSSGRYFSKAIASGSSDSWRLVFLYPLVEFERASSELLEAFLVSGLALLLLTTIFFRLLYREITRPLTNLRNNVRAIALHAGLDAPNGKHDEIAEITDYYLTVASHLRTAYEHKKLALEELETYKAELLRVNGNLHRRLFQVKVLLSLWSERDKAMDVKDFLSRFLTVLLPGLPFDYGCVIIRPLAHMSGETIFAKKLNFGEPSELYTEDTPSQGTQWTSILDPAVKEFLLRESEACMQSLAVKIGFVEGTIGKESASSTLLTVLSLSLKQGDEPLGSLHFLSEQKNLPIPDSLTSFLLNLSSQVSAQLQIQALSFATRIDPLTRLYNRGYLNDKLREELVRSSRNAQAFSLILLDLNNFSELTRSSGQQAADEVLRGLALLLRKNCRGSDAVCRFQGSALAILLTDTPLAGARIFADNVRKAIEAEEFSIPGGGKRKVTVSMGIAEHPAHGSGVDELITKAEQALAKAAGTITRYKVAS